MQGRDRRGLPVLSEAPGDAENAPLYDVLRTNTSEQWHAVEVGLVEPKLDVKNVPNLADVYPYAVSDKIVGVCAFTSAIGFGHRTDKGLPAPKSWKDLADAKYAGTRGSYVIPVNSLGQMHLMMLGKIYGKGLPISMPATRRWRRSSRSRCTTSPAAWRRRCSRPR